MIGAFHYVCPHTSYDVLVGPLFYIMFVNLKFLASELTGTEPVRQQSERC